MLHNVNLALSDLCAKSAILGSVFSDVSKQNGLAFGPKIKCDTK